MSMVWKGSPAPAPVSVRPRLLRTFGGIYFVEEWRKVKKKLKVCGKTSTATACSEADSWQARGLQHSNLGRTGGKRLRSLSALLPADSKELQWNLLL